MVALRDDVLPDETWLINQLRDSWSAMPAIDNIERRDDVISFDLGGDTVAVSLMHQPVPWTDLEGPCREAWYWPEAARALRDHHTHVLVVLVPKASQRIDAALSLTRVVAAVTACSQSAGVLWGGGGLVHSPEPFVEAARKSNRDSLPLQLWVAFGVHREEDGTHSLYTSGLEEFGHLEIEVAGSRCEPRALMDRVFNMALYVLDKGVVLQDGETIGASDDEKIEISHVASFCDGKTTVVRLGM
jgi:uncharacterized protein DUF4261